MIVVKAMH